MPEEHTYDVNEGHDISSSGTIVEQTGEGQGLLGVRLSASAGFAADYVVEVSNDGSLWWSVSTYSSVSAIGDTFNAPERRARLRNTSTVTDNVDAELSWSNQ